MPLKGTIKKGLPPEAGEAFRRAGVYHILAVSGFNLALLASSVFFVLSSACSASSGQECLACLRHWFAAS